MQRDSTGRKVRPLLGFLVSVNYTDEFYKKFSHALKPTGPKYRYQLKNSVEEFSVYEIKQQKLDNFKNYKCKALMYEINIDGTIENMCTGEVLPLMLKRENTHTVVKCPLSACSCDVMFNFYKEP
jgi:hypothetical protein